MSPYLASRRRRDSVSGLGVGAAPVPVTVMGATTVNGLGNATTVRPPGPTDMVRRHYFRHTSPDGGDPASQARTAGYPAAIAENTGIGDSPGIVASPWSPGAWVQVFGMSPA